VLDLASNSGAPLMCAVTALPRVPAGLPAERESELVAEEAALLDYVKSFAHVVNAADIDGVVDRYADDCVVISPRGRYAGTAAVRRNYELYYDPVRFFTLWTNVTARFVRPFDEAYVSAYQYSVGVNATESSTQGTISTDVWRVRRDDGVWKILERRIDILDAYNHRLLAAVSG
jgi:ketosteroid isomerase-like protein